MSRAHPHLSLVVDEVLAQAHASTRRRSEEARAIKEAEAQPRTDLARGLHSLASSMRTQHDDVTYADLAGVSR